MKKLLTLLVLLQLSSFGWSQSKKVLKELKKVYSNEELNAFKSEHGNLDLLFFAYDHAVYAFSNNGKKDLGDLPTAAHSTHFTDFGVKILSYNQYFHNETPNEIIGIKSLLVLQNELSQSLRSNSKERK
jgi:hypothetical protein